MYAVILAGGGGTRLWPLSRPERPKPFLPLLDAASLIQRTVDRLGPLVPASDVFVVTEERYRAIVLEQLPQLPPGNIVGEPVGRNTAAAVALAAVAIERPADDVMAVFPADHQVRDEDGFRDALVTAADVASVDALVTLGIQPDRPHTGYGYVLARQGGASGRSLHVERFVEKPDARRAAELLDTGRAYWNAGIFVWRRDALLRGLQRHASDILDALRDARASRISLESVYPALRATSIDYALLEPASLEGQVAVVPVDVGWSDLGDWAALLDALAGDGARDGTIVSSGPAEDLGSRDVLVHAAGDRLVVTIGLRGTIVVDTPDALLVCARDRAQDVKQILERLATAGETDER